MLARITYWDTAEATTLTYSNGRLAMVENPGGLTAGFGYDTAGRLVTIRDPLAYDVLDAGMTSYCQPASPGWTCDTTIAYWPGGANGGKVSSVRQPAPTPGAARPSRAYSYSTDSAEVDIAGFNPPSGFASRVRWDDQQRIIEQADAAGRTTSTVWDPNIDRPLRTIDPAGLQSTSVYDPDTDSIPLWCRIGEPMWLD